MMRDAAEHPVWAAHQPHVEAALARFPDPARYDFIVASGGRVSGYYHAYSDLDLYAGLTRDIADDEEFEIPVDGVPVQVSELTHALIARVAAELGEYRLTRDDRRQADAFATYGKLASRLVTGIVVRSTVVGDAALNALSLASFRRIGMSVHGLFVARMIEDAAGGVAQGDPSIGVQGAALALNAALDCLLFAAGDVHWGDALLWRRIAAHPALAAAGRLVSDGLQRLYASLYEPQDQALITVRTACRTASVLASAAAVTACGCDASEMEASAMLANPAIDWTLTGGSVPFTVAVSFGDGLSLLAPRSRTDVTAAEASAAIGLEHRRLAGRTHAHLNPQVPRT
jgi:hypothetical protein